MLVIFGGFWNSLLGVCSDVSEVYAASSFRVTECGSVGCWSNLEEWLYHAHGLDSFTLKMETINSCETLEQTLTAGCENSKNGHFFLTICMKWKECNIILCCSGFCWMLAIECCSFCSQSVQVQQILKWITALWYEWSGMCFGASVWFMWLVTCVNACLIVIHKNFSL
jgi:hypothetical protein